jgi:PAS domain S-box-containing protein
VTDRTAVPNIIVPLRALFDSLSDGVLVTDGAGYRTYSNPALNELVGADARDPQGTTDPPAFLPEDQHERYHEHLEMISSGRLDGEMISLDWEIFDAEGERIPVAMKLLPVRNGARNKSPAAVFWLMLDNQAESKARLPADRRRRDLEEGMRRIAGELHRLGMPTAPLPPSEMEPVPEMEELSPRERDVLDLLLEGHRVVTVSDELCVSTHTVRNHLKSIFRKLGVHSQAELIQKFRGEAGR